VTVSEDTFPVRGTEINFSAYMGTEEHMYFYFSFIMFMITKAYKSLYFHNENFEGFGVCF